jgi:hypothetical protein
MGGLILIQDLVTEARSVGLDIQLDGALLRIKGNRKAGAIAKELLNRKAEVVDYLVVESEPDENIETHGSAYLADEACPVCSGPLCFERGKQFLHAWCPRGGYDSWRALNGGKLGQSGAPIFKKWHNPEEGK